jgi:hypothetical protein
VQRATFIFVARSWCCIPLFLTCVTDCNIFFGFDFHNVFMPTCIMGYGIGLEGWFVRQRVLLQDLLLQDYIYNAA